ncbi:hypothetical protein MTO96_046348, partial [Rhipicephalus appendiculatus]
MQQYNVPPKRNITALGISGNSQCLLWRRAAGDLDLGSSQVELADSQVELGDSQAEFDELNNEFGSSQWEQD